MFSNGTEYEAFLERHCESCALYRPDADYGSGCPVEQAIGLTYITGKASDFPFEWLDPVPGMERYSCRKKKGKPPDNIRGPQRRQAEMEGRL